MLSRKRVSSLKKFKVLKNAKFTLPIIILAQLCGTSLWFSGNAIIEDLIQSFSLTEDAIAYLTSSVQLGFIFGTLGFALLAIVDRFSPSKVFFLSAILAAFANLGLTFSENTFTVLLVWRFFTGFFLAGIYPVGIKIAADYYDKALGRSLGYLVGALVLGTALPHLLKDLLVQFPWELIITCTSGIAITGGLLIYLFVPDGPFRNKTKSTSLNENYSTFNKKAGKWAAVGYFGHMWELYTFWAIVPTLLTAYASIHSEVNINISVYSFIIIAAGSLGCVVGGHLSERFGIKKVALIALCLSMLCCFMAPLFLKFASITYFLAFLCFWGVVVVADSPLFSTLVAQNAQPIKKGSTIVLVTCIGFAITIISIQLITVMIDHIGLQNSLPFLGVGPLLVILFYGTKLYH